MLDKIGRTLMLGVKVSEEFDLCAIEDFKENPRFRGLVSILNFDDAQLIIRKVCEEHCL